MKKPLFNWLDERGSGVLLHPTALPGDYGVGTLNDHCFQFIDFLADAGCSYWQICPLGPTGYGDSPYQSFSSYAINPYLISLRAMEANRLLDPKIIEDLSHLPQSFVDFGGLYNAKWPVLDAIFERFTQTDAKIRPYGGFQEFKDKHADWLEPYAYFISLKNHFGGAPWTEWPTSVGTYAKAKKDELQTELAREIEAQCFFQYLAFGQWGAVQEHAKKRGIQIIGDIPIFVALDSADVWQNPELFQFDSKKRHPKAVAGCPPDYFSEDGQLWGNPLYDWEAHEKDGYDWWIKRLRHCFELSDVVRIDHFRGFDSYWSIPYGSKTARTGKWVDGPGLKFFEVIKSKLGACKLIAEDLGELTDSVRQLRLDTGLPGMSILQFAFGSEADNLYLPHNLSSDTVLYPGTHDNDTTLGWYQSADDKTKDHARRYYEVSGDNIGWDFIRSSYRSVANLAIIPLQDLMSLGTEARFNSPGNAEGNWGWRYLPHQLDTLRLNSTDYLRSLGELYNRLPGK